MLRTNYRELATQWALADEQVRAVEIMDMPGSWRDIGHSVVPHTFDWRQAAILTPEEFEVVQRFRAVACVRAA